MYKQTEVFDAFEESEINGQDDLDISQSASEVYIYFIAWKKKSKVSKCENVFFLKLNLYFLFLFQTRGFKYGLRKRNN